MGVFIFVYIKIRENIQLVLIKRTSNSYYQFFLLTFELNADTEINSTMSKVVSRVLFPSSLGNSSDGLIPKIATFYKTYTSTENNKSVP